MDLELASTINALICGIPGYIMFNNSIVKHNIWYQKIEYLNGELKNVSTQEFSNFRITCFKEFRFNSKISISDFPRIYKPNLMNLEYNEYARLINSRSRELTKKIKSLVIIYLVSQLIISIIYFDGLKSFFP